MTGKGSEQSGAPGGAGTRRSTVLPAVRRTQFAHWPMAALSRVLGMTAPVTEVELVFYGKRLEYWLRFGDLSRERILDRRRRVIAFAPGEVFGFVRWEGNDYGTVSSRLDVVRAAEAGEPITAVPGINPGGDILLRLDGWPRVKQALDAITAIEALGIDPAAVAPDWWRHLHNRIVCNEPFRPYEPTQHRAWLLRRRIAA